MTMNIHNAEFIKSAAAASGFITDNLPQIVFCGRSNVGKSSLINRLLNRKNMARISSVPGKTIHVNYFLIDKTAYFTDLPGYGYANVAKSERYRWSKLMESFFSSSLHIALGVLIVDARHVPTNDDMTMAGWFKNSGRPFTVVANKIDKVKNTEITGCVGQVRDRLSLEDKIKLIHFSARTGSGREELLSQIELSLKDWNNGT